MTSSLTIRLADGRRDLDLVHRLRSAECGSESWFHPDLDRERDRAGFVWIAEHGGRPVATTRALPYSSGLGELTGLDLPLELPPLNDQWVEVGRFVALQSARMGVAFLLLRSAARWLLVNTSHYLAIGMCAGELVPYYRRFGLQVSEDGYPVEYFGSQLSHLVHGDLRRTVRSE